MEVCDLGLVDFDSAWNLQKERQRGLIDGTSDEVLFVCEHPPVITIGNGATEQNLLQSEADITSSGIAVRKIERGGDVTYHGPGQLVIYPIIDLRRRRTDVNWYMRLLEDCIISALSAQGISGSQIPGKTGVWVLDSAAPGGIGGRKIAAIGVRLSRWCTMHGLAVYLEPQAKGFDKINPCGMPGIAMTSVKELGGDASIVKSDLIARLIEKLRV